MELHSGSGAMLRWGGGGGSSSFITPSPGLGNYRPSQQVLLTQLSSVTQRGSWAWGGGGWGPGSRTERSQVGTQVQEVLAWCLSLCLNSPNWHIGSALG